MEKIRSFIAVELPGEVKQSLAGLQAKLKASGITALKWVEPQNIHLTLKFLGDIDTGAISGITAAIEVAAGSVHPFTITVSELGVFPSLKRVRVVWVGLNGEIEKLNSLQKNIEAGLTPLGIPPEGRGFSPHLTIARVRDYARPEEIEKLGRIIEKTAYDTKHNVPVNAVNLMQSQLTREGPIYTKISTILLK
jgi:RNA 2',3'-cyclic 3'-phosphodiesterase